MGNQLTNISAFVPTNRVDGHRQQNLNVKEIKKEDFQPLRDDKTPFASVSEDKIKNKLELKKEETPEQKLDRLHGITAAMKSAETPQNIQKFFKSLWMKIKDSGAGRFFTRNIIPKFTTPTITGIGTNSEVDENKRTKLKLTLKGSAKEVRHSGEEGEAAFDEKDSQIVLEWARMRGVTRLEKIKSFIFRTPLRSEPEEIAAKVQEDMKRQTYLRNCGVGYRAEKTFRKHNEGFIKLLSNPKAISIRDFSVAELENLKGDLSPEDHQTIEALIQSRNQLPKDPSKKQLKAIDSREAIGNLKSLVLKAHLNRLESVRSLCGGESFSDSHRDALERLNGSLKNSKALDSAILACSRDLQEISTMLDAALRRGPEQGNDYFQQNIQILRQGREAKILPDSVLTAPWFFSPNAARNQAENLRKLAADANLGDLKAKIAEALKVKEQGIQLDIQEEKTPEQELKELAESYDDLANNKQAMYRFQGIMFALAANNADEIKTALTVKTHEIMQTATGLRETGDKKLETIAGVILGAGAIVQATRGKWKSATVLAALGAGAAAAGGPNSETVKVRARTGMIVDAILSGMVTGSLDHIAKANHALAECKADEATRKWFDDQICKDGNPVGIVADSIQILENQKVEDIKNNFESYKEASLQDREKLGTLETLLSQPINQKINGLKDVTVACQNRAEKLGSIDKALKLKAGDIKVHDKLHLSDGDIVVDAKVANELRKANRNNLDAAKSVTDSLDLLKRTLCQGDVLGQLEKVETSLQKLFDESPSKLNTDQIQDISNRIELLRGKVYEKSSQITTDHAALIHEVINAVDENAGRIVKLKQAMNRLASDIAKGSVTEDNYEADLALLEAAVENSNSTSGKQNFALFSGKETAAKIHTPLKEFVEEVKTAKKEWNNYQATKNALASVSETSFNQVLDQVSLQKPLLLAAAAGLQNFADKHCESAGVTAANFAELANQEVENVLLKQAASILGVESNESTKAGLALFAGPFAKNESIWIKTRNHLESKGDRSQALQQLCKSLPEFNIRDAHSSEAETKIATWKNSVTSDQGLQFVRTLVPGFNKNQTDLSDAITVATALDPQGDKLPLQRQIHLEHIETQLEAARQNPTIKYIYGAENKDLDPTIIIEHHARFKGQLEDVGLQKIDFDAKKLTANYRENKETLSLQDLGHLSQLTESLATLRADIDATKKARHEAEMWTFLTKINPAIKEKETSEDLLKELQAAKFEFVRLEKTPEYTKLNEYITVNQKSLKASENALLSLEINGNKFRREVQELGVDKDAVKKIGVDPETTNYATQFAKAMTDWNRGLFRGNLQEYKRAKLESHLTKNNFKDSQKETKSKSKQLDQKLLQYIDPLKLAKNATLAYEDSIISDADELLKNRPALILGGGGYRSPITSVNVNTILPEVSERSYSSEVKGYLAQLPYEQRPMHDGKDLFKTITRLATNPVNLQLGAKLHDLIENSKLRDSQSKDVQRLKEILTNADSDRSRILGDVEKNQVTNALRSAIVKACLIDNDIKPTNLTRANVDDVKKTLKTWGWDESKFPADILIEKALNEVIEAEKIPEGWISEAGEFKHKSKLILEQLQKIQEIMVNSILKLDNEIKAHPDIPENQEKTSNLYESNLWNSNAITHLKTILNANSSITMRTPYEAAKISLDKLFDKYKGYFEGSAEGLNEKRQEILTKLQDLERDNKPWSAVSKAVSEAIDGTDGSRPLFDIAYDLTKRPDSYYKLTSIAKMDFESESAKVLSNDHSIAEKEIMNGFDNVLDHQSKVEGLTVGQLFPTLCQEETTTFVSRYAASQSRKDLKQFAQELAEQPVRKFFADFKEGEKISKFLAENSKQNQTETQSSMKVLGQFQDKLAGILSEDHFQQSKITELNKLLASLPESLDYKDSGIGKSPFTSLVKHLNSDLATIKKQMTNLANEGGNLLKKRALTKVQFTENEKYKFEKFSELTNEPNPYRIAQPVANSAQVEEVKPEVNLASTEAEIELIIEEDQPKVPVQNASIPQVEPRIQQQLDAFQSQSAVVNPPDGQGQSQASPSSFDKVKFDSFAQGDTSRPKTNNTDWNKATGKPQELQDFVHIPASADGYCLLTSLAASKNQTTRKLIEELDNLATSLDPEEKKRWEMAKHDAKTADGIDQSAIVALLVKAGLNFRVVQLKADGAFDSMHPLTGDPQPSKDSPVLLFRESHFDLLLPKSVADQNSLPFDGSKFIKNDVLQK